MLLWLVLIPMLAGLLALAAGTLRPVFARWLAVAALLVDALLLAAAWLGGGPGAGGWNVAFHAPWIPRFGMSLHLAADGLSVVLLALTLLLGLVAVVCSWTQISERVGFFHFNLLWTLAGIVGVFLALDLFLFYLFWELMLVPMFFLIGIWGSEGRTAAALKFFLFTQLGGLLMLVAILGLVFAHQRATGVVSFDYLELLGTPLSSTMGLWLMLGFFVAFAIKLPMVGLHTWLPDAHTQAPTAASVILAGLLLKTGGYGLLRFVLPLFPQAAHRFAPVAMGLGAAGVLYGALLAFGQTDLKRLVAYTSVSHLGFVLLAAFAATPAALQGAVLQMIAHGLSTGALFVLVGFLYERTHTRDLQRLGGLWDVAPRMGGLALFFALASLGLPGLANFIAEFLVLLGSYQPAPVTTCVAVAGLVGSTIYALWLVQRTFFGAPRETWRISDLSVREVGTLLCLVAGLVWLGLYPQPVLDLARPVLEGHAAEASR
jgi:NADH-quinone oxidoreductase subunit M